MSDNCVQCKKIITIRNRSNEPDFIDCDLCKGKFHPECTQLSATEIRVFALKNTKRSVKYFCPNCDTLCDPILLRSTLDKLSTQIDALEKSNKDLKEELKILQNSNYAGATSSVDTLRFEDMYAEFVERESRSRNVLVHGVSESADLSPRQQLAQDKQLVSTLLSPIIGAGKMDFFVTRLGKVKSPEEVTLPLAASLDGPRPKKVGPRPIKVSFSDAKIALMCLRGKDKITGSAKLGADRTKRQRDHLFALLEKLHKDEENGITNQRLKYINGVPTISVTTPSSTSKTSSNRQEN